MIHSPVYMATGSLLHADTVQEDDFFLRSFAEIPADGFEFMAFSGWYENAYWKKIARKALQRGFCFPVLHMDKKIGVLLSEQTDESIQEALRLFQFNLEIGAEIGVKKAVLHLWGGVFSDSRIAFPIALYEKLEELAHPYPFSILIENIPCTTHSPLQNWEQLYQRYPQIQFTLDTRFGAFHQELEKICHAAWLWTGRIAHIHISDFQGTAGNFKNLRPILHPREEGGHIDFDAIFEQFPPYSGSFTLESPCIYDGKADYQKVANSIHYIRKLVDKNEKIYGQKFSIKE